MDASGVEIDVIKDYEMIPGARRAKIIMQTCAHVSGAAYFYDKKLIPVDEKKNLQKVIFSAKLSVLYNFINFFK